MVQQEARKNPCSTMKNGVQARRHHLKSPTPQTPKGLATAAAAAAAAAVAAGLVDVAAMGCDETIVAVVAQPLYQPEWHGEHCVGRGAKSPSPTNSAAPQFHHSSGAWSERASHQ